MSILQEVVEISRKKTQVIHNLSNTHEKLVRAREQLQEAVNQRKLDEQTIQALTAQVTNLETTNTKLQVNLKRAHDQRAGKSETFSRNSQSILYLLKIMLRRRETVLQKPGKNCRNLNQTGLDGTTPSIIKRKKPGTSESNARKKRKCARMRMTRLGQ